MNHLAAVKQQAFDALICLQTSSVADRLSEDDLIQPAIDVESDESSILLIYVNSGNVFPINAQEKSRSTYPQILRN